MANGEIYVKIKPDLRNSANACFYSGYTQEKVLRQDLYNLMYVSLVNAVRELFSSLPASSGYE